ncbi:unnamed protein product, partial [Porites lobata]
LAKHQYAARLQEGVGLIPALRVVPNSVGSSHQREEQVSSFFSRLALKVRQQQVEVSEEDALAVEEQSNFATAKENVLSSLQLRHPIVVDQYNVCSLVNNKSEFRKTKVALLQHLCERLELNTPVPAVRRKAPYVELLEEVVNSCCCNHRK